MKIGRALVDGETIVCAITESEVVEIDGTWSAEPTGRRFARADARLLAPIVPNRILIVLAGWLPLDGSVAHDGKPPAVTVKLGELRGPNDAVAVPEFVSSGEVYVEPELAVVVGAEVSCADVDTARDAIAGFTIFNDLTAAEHLRDKPDFFKAKSIDGFSCLGPWITTDLTDADVATGITIRCTVNGAETIAADTSFLKVPPSALLSAISQQLRLVPGDLVSLGCPPPRPPLARAGDEFEVEIDRIGTLSNRLIPGADRRTRTDARDELA